MYKLSCLRILIFLFVCVNCAGRTPNPIMITNPADNKASCEDIKQELDKLNQRISASYYEIKKEENFNLLIGLAGAFIPFAGVFSDYKRADLVEESALRKRFNHLVEVERGKGCGFEHSLKPVLEHCEDFHTLGCFWQP
jgi:hypothetical protein